MNSTTRMTVGRWTRHALLVLAACGMLGCGLISAPAPRRPKAKPAPRIDLDPAAMFQEQEEALPWSFWVASEMVSLTPTMKARPDIDVFPQETIQLAGAANEVVSVQLIIDAPDTPIEAISVKPSFLDGPDDHIISFEQVKLFRLHPVQIRHFPAWFLRSDPEGPRSLDLYDALSPLAGDASTSLASGERLALWVDIRLPRTAAPGVYTGDLQLRGKGMSDRDVPVQVTVHDLILPDTRPLPVVGGFSYRSVFSQLVHRENGTAYVPDHLDLAQPLVREGVGQITTLMTLAHTHGLDLFDRDLKPRFQRDFKGNVRIEWTDYDAIVEPYLTGSAFEDNVGVSVWPIPLTARWPNPDNYGGADDEAYHEIVRTVVTESAAHLATIGGKGKLIAWTWRDMKDSQPQRALAKRIEADSRGGIPVLVPTPAPGKAPATGVTIQTIDGRDLTRATKSGTKKQWLLPGPPPYLPNLSILATPADIRVLPWLADKYGCQSLFIPDVLAWPGPADAPGRLFYPGPMFRTTGVLPSVRLKRLRRGLQDMSYLSILRQRGHAAVAGRLLDTMARYAGQDALRGEPRHDPRLNGWVTDPAAWAHLNTVLAAETIAAVHPKAKTQNSALASTIRWHRMHQLTGQLLVESTGTRLSLRSITPKTPKSPPVLTVDARVRISLYNPHETARVVSAVTEWLPGGATRRDPAAAMRIEPATPRRTLEIQLDLAKPHGNPNGKIPLPVSLRPADSDPIELPLEIPLLVAGRMAKPPEIDGVLSDWPAHPGASASDFRLLGNRGAKGQLARRATVAVAMQDSKYLYFAIRCTEPNMDAIQSKATNRLHYEQALAVGEDVIELLLDPGGKARSSDDLYHIAIKPNGVLVQELGVKTKPAIGTSQAVNLAPEIAVTRETGAWIVEMRLPRSAFGLDGKATTWRVNFIRHAAQGAETSSWARNRRSPYNVNEMGTMFVPDAKTGKLKP